jgi:chromosome segregation ATPase
VESLLTFADELERRDEEIAAALARVEAQQAELEEIRTHAAAVSGFLASLPDALAAQARDEDAAEDERRAAEAAVRAAEAELAQARRRDERLRAERAVQRARDEVSDAGRRAERAREHQRALAREGDERRVEGERLERRAAELQPTLRDVEPPAGGLPGVLAWASQAHGALLVEHAGLARERETVVREASELLASVLGDPLAATSAAGLRARLERALA